MSYSVNVQSTGTHAVIRSIVCLRLLEFHDGGLGKNILKRFLGEKSKKKCLRKTVVYCTFIFLKAFTFFQFLANGTNGRELIAFWEPIFRIVEPGQNFQIKAYS